MAEKTVAQKLGLKAGFKVLILNAPAGYLDSLGDLQRESVWEAMSEVTDWRPVSQIALDAVWSALRFRPESDVKPRKKE
jgi:hypothetical protein